MVAKNSTLEELLKSENSNLQASNYAQLKDLGRDLVALEEKIREMTAEKSHAVKHLDELDHHQMLWKYKITFELKTQVSPQLCQAVYLYQNLLRIDISLYSVLRSRIH